MALQSRLLRGDPKLEAAAVSDPAHIVRGSRGPHVAKIQQALIQLDGAPISQDSAYGQATAAAVSAFKQKRNILNFKGQIDEIVGKQTIAALDAGMLANENNGGGRSAGPASAAGGLLLGFGIDEDLTSVRHNLIYFSGDVDGFGNGGVLLTGNHGQEVLTDMEGLTAPNSDQKPIVRGFGGSLKNKQKGVTTAAALLAVEHDASAKLIIYGYSAGGINSLDLCRILNPVGTTVDLLVTVDVSGRGEVVNRVVPPNVRLNRNYFQTDTLTFSKAVGGKAIGRNVFNIDCNDRNFEVFTTKTRHGQMQDITRFEAVRDMRIELKK